MSFAYGFEKTAVSKQFLWRAANKAKGARNLVAALSEKEGLFPGPLAAKYDAQKKLFSVAARSRALGEKLSVRKKLRLKQEKGPSLYRGKQFLKLFGNSYAKQKLKPQDILDIVSTLKTGDK